MDNDHWLCDGPRLHSGLSVSTQQSHMVDPGPPDKNFLIRMIAENKTFRYTHRQEAFYTLWWMFDTPITIDHVTLSWSVHNIFAPAGESICQRSLSIHSKLYEFI